jgi:hypothetical protein
MSSAAAQHARELPMTHPEIRDLLIINFPSIPNPARVANRARTRLQRAVMAQTVPARLPKENNT